MNDNTKSKSESEQRIMPMHYRDMCEQVRALMVSEVESDGESVYISAYFTPAGAKAWRGLLLDACRFGDDATLALSIGPNFMKSNHSYIRMGKPVTARVPPTAPQKIAESNFSRYYLRALCQLAISRGIPHLVGYRAMAVAQPRQGSEEKIGAHFAVREMLADITETMSGEPQLGMPPGVGSGILARLP